MLLLQHEFFRRDGSWTRGTHRVCSGTLSSGLRDSGSVTDIVLLLRAHESADAALFADSVADVVRVHPQRHLHWQIPAEEKLGDSGLPSDPKEERIDPRLDRLIHDAAIGAASQREVGVPVARALFLDRQMKQSLELIDLLLFQAPNPTLWPEKIRQKFDRNVNFEVHIVFSY